MLTGLTVADRFEVERRAGAGGMSVVYQARDRESGQRVALKVLGVIDTVASGRFQREGRVLADLRHPGIVKFVAHGMTAAGERWLAMEWLEGEDLAEHLLKEDLAIPDAILLAQKVAEALAFAHGRGVVHRDIKPANLFLVDGRIDLVKILDFGVARLEGEAGQVTRSGFRVGTPAYMSPEQARGRSQLDARADVFSLGAVLYECISGRKAFAADDAMAILAKILLEEPPPLIELHPEVPSELSRLVQRMLAKEPDERPHDASEVLAELASLESRVLTPIVPAEEVRFPIALTQREQRLMCVVLARDLPCKPGGELDALVAAHGGRLDPLADDAVLVTLAREGDATDLAAKAARLALAVRARSPGALLAIATGRGVVAGSVPVGQVIDAAARMLRALGSDRTEVMPLVPGQHVPTDPPGPTPIRLDEVTAGLLGAAFDVGGDAEGLELFGEREPFEHTRTLMGRPTPLVGRDPEMATLLTTFDACASEPEARPVLITGPAGIGKSRLRYELLRALELRREAVEVWMARGDPMGAGAPFGLVAGALRRAAGLQGGETLEVLRQKLRARVARHVPTADVQRVAEFLGELVGAPFSDETSPPLRAARRDAMLMGDQMRRAFEDLLAAEASDRPILIVLEDLHWGDVPSVKFIDSVLRNLRDRPLMVLALARPDVHDTFPRLWAERGLQEMRLGELTRRASERLVKQVLPEAGADTIARVVDRAAGNALYLEELIRVTSEAGSTERLPDSVIAMVEARLEGLEAEARRVLRAAAVFGQVFWESGVEALLGGPVQAGALGEWLTALTDREVITLRRGSKLQGEREYTFRHGLVRDAAYAMLTELDRATGHRLAGEWLELVGESDALVLAEHFERGGEPRRAVEQYRRAAVQALEGDDFPAVLLRVERGVQCGASGEVLGRLRLLQAEAHRWRGEVVPAERAALEALSLVRAGTDAFWIAIEETAFASGPAGNRQRLVDLHERTLSAVGGPSDAHDQAAARLCVQLLHNGRPDLADTLILQIEKRPQRNPAVQARIWAALATRANFEGNLGLFLSLSEAAVRAFEESGDLRNAARSRGSAAYASLELGDFAGAEFMLRNVLRMAEPMGLHTVAATARQNLGLAVARGSRGLEPEARRRALAEARDLEEESARAFAAEQHPRMEAASRYYLALVLLEAGDAAGAEASAREALDIAAGPPLMVPVRAEGLAVLAEVLVALGRPADAVTAAREAVQLLSDLGGIDGGESLIRTALVDALLAAGRTAEAHEAARAAAARLDERAMRIDDPALRERFLRDVPENARVLEIARGS